MNSLRTNPPHGFNNGLNIQLPLHARTWRRDLPTALGARMPSLQYRLSYSSLDAAACLQQAGAECTLVIDALYDDHLRRQAMVSAFALLRGDDGSDKVW